jgi:hypothetical protein
MTASTTRATVGRKVWYWTADRVSPEVLIDPKQPFDATVVFVHEDGRVNLRLHDHRGRRSSVERIELRDPRAEVPDEHGHDNYATWMPYQKAQEAKAIAAAETAPMPMTARQEFHDSRVSEAKSAGGPGTQKL